MSVSPAAPSGAAGAPAAPESSAQAPARENLLRAGLRSLLLRDPMLGALATLPLKAFAVLAFVGPVAGGLALGGATAAAALRPWMLGTALGMTASFSFLKPLFGWIPLKVRIALAYAAATGLAYTFLLAAPGLPALWLAANILLSAKAAVDGFEARAETPGTRPIDRMLNATEAAAFFNLLGYQALLPILVLGGAAPLAYAILAASTLLALSLLVKTGARVPVRTLVPLAAPFSPGDPEPGPGPRKIAASKKPAREPFVPATRVVEELERLLKADPAAALTVAAAALIDENERRSEVKIGALRVLDALPVAQTLPAYVALLESAARSGVQTSKGLNVDPWWYLQREALKRVAREAAALKPAPAPLLDALRVSYKDRNASVRLAAAAALTALGEDPGDEIDPAPPAPKLRPMILPPSARQPMPRPAGGVNLKRLIITVMLAASLLLGIRMISGSSDAPAKAPTEQVVPADTAKAARPDSLRAAAADSLRAAAADSLAAAPKTLDEQIAANTKRMADAAERQAAAAEEAAKPKGSFLSSLLWMVLPIFLLVFLLKRMGGGMGGGAPGVRTQPKTDLEKPTTRFSDVAGIDESLVEVQEIIDFLRDPGRFKRLGARMPKGILMEGPPGTGKTLLAKALAGETDATFIPISGSAFVELYVGMGASRVRALFETARKHTPAIIFIDEIDAVGKKRGDGSLNGGNDEREQTINQILKELDGFDNSSGVIVVAATNRADTLDAALTRPGRFDRKIHVGLPEALGREAILALHAKKARLAADVDLRLIARRSAGLSGAYLENVVNEAAMLAARRGADAIGAADVDEAVDRATIGGKRSLRLSEPLKRRIAAHEAGHVLANLLNEKPELRVPVNKVTILPHGSGALGFAESGSDEGDKYLYTRGELESRLDTALGGLVAEKIFYGEWSTGPGSDLESATRVARAMVQQLGMSDELGLAQTSPDRGDPLQRGPFGDEIGGKVHAAVNKLLQASLARVEARLRAGADKHKAMIEALMTKETLSADEIEAIAHPKAAP